MENRRRSLILNVATISAFVALSLLLFYVENFLPPLIPVVPFAKIGLSNIVTLVALYCIGGRRAFVVLVTRCVLASLFMGNVFSLVYSLSGAVASFLVMLFFYKTCRKFLNICVISVLAAITHNIVQVLIAWAIVGNIYVLSFLAYLLLISIIAGIITALCAKFAISKIYLKKEHI